MSNAKRFFVTTLIAFLTPLLASADVFDDAARVLGPRASAIRRLSAEHHASLQAYFTRLNERLDYPEEVARARPIVILVDEDEGPSAGFVVPGNFEFLFWNLRFLTGSPNADVDLFMLSFLRPQYDLPEPSHAVHRGYASDEMLGSEMLSFRYSEMLDNLEMIARLFRVGMYDHDGIDPLTNQFDPRLQRLAKAPFDSDAVWRFIDSSWGRSYLRAESHITVYWSQLIWTQYRKRSFAEAPSARRELYSLLSEHRSWPKQFKLPQKAAAMISTEASTCESMLGRVLKTLRR